MEIVRGILFDSWDLFNRMSPYLLFGFLFAGVLHILVSLDAIARHLGQRSISSVIKAVILGIPLPLCSCSVIPSALLLKKKGASRGAVIGFLIATPITGIDSILATFSLLGGLFTVFRIIAASVTALVAGILTNLLLPHEAGDVHTHSYPPAETDPECCHEEAAKRNMGFMERIVELFRYAFVELVGDIWKWLLMGVLIGGAITYLVPESLIQRYLGSSWQSMIVMLIIGIPMYVCATGSIPIAAALMLKGLSPGAALVFLLAGPATNAVTFTVVSKELGRGAVAIYLASIAAMSVIMGLILDAVWYGGAGAISGMAHHAKAVPAWLEITSSIALGILIVFSAIKGQLAMRRGCPHDHDNKKD